MRSRIPALITLLSLACAAAVPGAACAARAPKAAPSCSDLSTERAALVRQSKTTTGEVEAKNRERGEAADALKVAKDDARKDELNRRIEGLRRELSALETKELSET